VTTTLRFTLTGIGNIGRTLLEVLHSRAQWLRARHDLELRAVALADASGAAADPDGLDMGTVVALKKQGLGVATMRGVGRPGQDALALIGEVEADLLLEATPTNHHDGQPGLDIVRAALARGMDCVLASKGPLAVAYAELAGRSDLARGATIGAPALRFSGAVGGALPSINIGRRDLAGGRITRVEAVLNGTTQMILGLRARGLGFAEALAEAQRVGIAEPDAELDIGGWDAACKLVILANAVLGRPVGLADVSVTGIADVTTEELRAAWAGGGRMSLLAVAQALPGDGVGELGPRYRLSVAPTLLRADHPLARLGLEEMGIVYYSDIFGRTTAMSLEDGPVGSVAAMLRDVIEIAGLRRLSPRTGQSKSDA
jgi:homoserine dehydrogenase